MAKHAFRKLVPTVVGIGILIPTTYFAYDGYVKSTAPSNFEVAAARLGFTGYKKADRNISSQDHQEALLKQLQIAGYFQPANLWKAIIGLGVKDPATAFKQIYPAIKKSHADQSDPSKFNAKILRKNLGKGTELDEQDTMDLPTLKMAMAAMSDRSSVARDVAKSLNISTATLYEYVNGDGSPKEPATKLLTNHANK